MRYALRRALSLDLLMVALITLTSEHRQKSPAVLSAVRLARSDYPD